MNDRSIAVNQASSKKTRNAGMALFILGLFLVGGALVFVLTSAQQKALDPAGFVLQPAQVTYAAPKIALTDLEQKSVVLADYRGKVILVNNWATWCPPCKAEMPVLQAYYDQYSSKGLVVIGIESGEPAATVSEFAQTYKLTFPIWLDPHGSAVEAFKNWDLPSTYLIDKQGNVQLSWTGPVNKVTLEKYVTPYLEK